MKKHSLRQLAKELGVSASYLSQVRHGKRPVSQKVLSKISENVKQVDGLSSPCQIQHQDVRIPDGLRGPLAQLAEQLTLNQQVRGSIPRRLRFKPIIIC